MRDLHFPGRSPVRSTEAMVATSHPLASAAALQMLKGGGNAMDAAICAAAVLAVVEPQSTGIGGDCFALYCPRGEGPVLAFNGSGRSPAAASLDWYRERDFSEMPTFGPHAVTIPGAIDAWCRLLADHGSRDLTEILARVTSAEPTARPIAADELDEYYRVDAAAFGVRFDAAQVEAKRPIVEPSRFFLSTVDGVTAGAAGSFPFDLTVPGGVAVAVCGVSDVGVLPTQRRRGVLRSLLSPLLDDAADRGEVAAVLTASEATIYGRFGFGVATRRRTATVVATRSAFRPDAPVAPGRCRTVDRVDAAGDLADVYERSARCGTLSRSPAWWAVMLGDTDLFIGGHRDLMVLVHDGSDGRPDAYALYRVEERWDDTGPGHTLVVVEVVGVDVAAELAVWRVLLDHDLVEHVRAPLAADHVLGDVLADPRALVSGTERDDLWCRPLDVTALLSARRFGTDGALVLDVRDEARPATAGRYRVESHDGVATVARDDGEADLVLDVAELGSCSLGGTSFRRLVRAGRVAEARPGAATRADGLFATDPLPFVATRF